MAGGREGVLPDAEFASEVFARAGDLVEEPADPEPVCGQPPGNECARRFLRIVAVAEEQLAMGKAARPDASLDGRVIDVAVHEKEQLAFADAVLLVDGALLRGVAAEAAQRLRCVDQLPREQEMAPHFQIHDLAQARIESACGTRAAKHDGGGLADQIFPAGEAACDRNWAVVDAGRMVVPKTGDLGVVVDEQACGPGERGARVLVEHGGVARQRIGGGEEVVAETEFNIFAACVGRGTSSNWRPCPGWWRADGSGFWDSARRNGG